MAFVEDLSMLELHCMRKAYAVLVGLKGILNWINLAPSSKCSKLHTIIRELHNLVKSCPRQNAETLLELARLAGEALLVF